MSESKKLLEKNKVEKECMECGEDYYGSKNTRFKAKCPKCVNIAKKQVGSS